MAYLGTPIDTINQFQSLQGKRFSGDGSTTDFTLDIAPSSVFDIEVFVENVRQDPNSAYSLSGTTLTFAAAPPSGTNNIYVIHQAKAVGTINPGDGTVSLDKLSATGTKDATTFLRGDNTFASIETRIAWQSSIKTSDFTASSNEGYWVDTSSNTVTITFPSNPSVGDTIELVDYARNWGTNKIIIDSNGKNYQGDPDTFAVEYDTSGQGLRVVYSGTTKGWIPTSDEVSEDNPVNQYSVDFLVVAGGAGGGVDSGGGGGAGGYRASYNNEASGGGGSSESALTVVAGTQYTVTVGAGGASTNSNGTRAGGGSNSVFGSITSTGGGQAGNGDASVLVGLSGGSGGGGGAHSNAGVVSGGAGTANQGFDGGDANGGGYPNRKGGGGGGASAAGGDASTTVAGNGGNGVASTITGSSVTRAGGGGGGGQNAAGTPGSGGSGGGGAGSVDGTGTAGTANTGGGGGAASFNQNSGAGGSGIVILRMATAKYSGTTTGSPSVTTSGSDTILTYTGSGSYTA